MVAYIQPVEIYYDGDWHPITNDDPDLSRVRDDIVITRGAGPDTGLVPSKLTCTILNDDLVFSPQNPESPLWGKIGPNTLLRNYYRAMRDTFARTVSGGWGSASDGRAWAVTATGSGSSASFAVGGSAASVALAASSTYTAHLADADGNRFRLAEVRFRFTLSAVPDGSILVLATLRRIDANNFYAIGALLGNPTVLLGIIRIVGGELQTLASTDTGITYTGQELTLAALAEGPALSAKVWSSTSGEPRDWQLRAVDTELPAAGTAGVHARVSTITNGPITLTIDDFEIRVPRFVGEVERWPQQSSADDKVFTVPVNAFGPTRRLTTAGTRKPARSAMRRYVSRNNPLAYWPLSDGADSSIGLALTPETDPIGLVYSNGIDAAAYFGRDDATAQLAPHLESGVVVVGTVVLRGDIPGSIGTQMSVDTAMRLEGVLGTTSFMSFALGNAANDGVDNFRYFAQLAWDMEPTFVLYRENEALSATLMDTADPSVALTLMDNKLHHVRLTATQDGGDVDVVVFVDGEFVMSGTHSSATLGGAGEAEWQLTAFQVGRAVIGHAVAWDDSGASAADVTDALRGFPGETAGVRLFRILDEEGFAGLVVGETVQMGAQAVARPIETVENARVGDGGVLVELRGTFGFLYYPHTSLSGPSVALEIPYGGGGVGSLIAPEDTAGMVNEVRVRRTGGAEATVRDQDHINRYDLFDADAQVNVYSPFPDDDGTLSKHTAGWIVHVGTWPESRYSVIALRPDAVAKQSDLFNAMLALDVPDRIYIPGAPKSHGPNGVDQLIRGLTEQPRDNTWTIAGNGQPSGPWRVGILGVHRAGSEASVLDTGIDTTETTLLVDYGAGDRWIDSANFSSQFPFDIGIGGERITVTGIAGTTSPQTFTVVRSVNGVVKSHDVGAPVQAWEPFRFARGGLVDVPD